MRKAAAVQSRAIASEEALLVATATAIVLLRYLFEIVLCVEEDGEKKSDAREAQSRCMRTRTTALIPERSDGAAILPTYLIINQSSHSSSAAIDITC